MWLLTCFGQFHRIFIVNVVITQSMLFPWVGMLEQMKLADVLVHYDDVQYSKGSFTNRVQVKTCDGVRWMTIPLQNFTMGQLIDGVSIQNTMPWRERHMALLAQSFKGAPHAKAALGLVERVYSAPYESIGALARSSMVAIANYYGLLDGKCVVDVRTLGIAGASSDRVLKVVTALGGDNYITGHGASNYLEHDVFELAGVDVLYMKYECQRYPQSWGEFTPYVTGLDLVANCGPSGIDRICSRAVRWREFAQSRKGVY